MDPERDIAGFDIVAGDVEMDVAGGGVYWTRYGATGAYLDVSAQLLSYRKEWDLESSNNARGTCLAGATNAAGRKSPFNGTVTAFDIASGRATASLRIPQPGQCESVG